MWAIAYGPDPGEREQPLGHLIVGQRRVVERLEVEPPLGDVAGERPQVGPAVAGAGDIAVRTPRRRGASPRAWERRGDRGVRAAAAPSS